MFLVNSRHPLVCAPRRWLPTDGAPFSRSYGGILPSSFNTVLSSALVCSTCPPVSVWGTVLTAGLFPGTPRRHSQSNKDAPLQAFVTSARPGNINPVPIGYGFRPHLRGRLTLRGLALRRNPWTFGERVSHPLYRYSCQHYHFRYLQDTSRCPFNGLRNAPLPVQKSEDRSQKTQDFNASAKFLRGLVAFSRFHDIHPANAAMSPRRRNPGPGNILPIPASRRWNPWPSKDTV